MFLSLMDQIKAKVSDLFTKRNIPPHSLCKIQLMINNLIKMEALLVA